LFRSLPPATRCTTMAEVTQFWQALHAGERPHDVESDATAGA
jgi:hypothetical protein